MATKVKVAARLRPLINSEHPDNAVIVSPTESTISIANLRNANERFKFSFSSCYDQSASQEEIFEKDVRPLVDHVVNGLVYVIHLVCLAENITLWGLLLLGTLFLIFMC
jgi:kinesin family member 22